MSVKILEGDCLAVLRTLPEASVHCCVTSPPYFGLRDYGVDGQIGLETSPADFVAKLVDVFREVRRVLRNDGTLWLNLGDSYANDGKWGGSTSGKHASKLHGDPIGRGKRTTGLKPKDLIGIPWRVAFALQDDGWWLRNDHVWSKPNAMPDPAKDRATRSHEYVFHLAKSQRYYFDSEAVKEPAVSDHPSGNGYDRAERVSIGGRGQREPWNNVGGLRNIRTVWTVPTQPFPEAHFATFPPDLIEPCIKAGCPSDGTVLDPFGGAGTTGLVADRLQRDAILIELNPEYAAMARKRIISEAGMFARVA